MVEVRLKYSNCWSGIWIESHSVVVPTNETDFNFINWNRSQSRKHRSEGRIFSCLRSGLGAMWQWQTLHHQHLLIDYKPFRHWGSSPIWRTDAVQKWDRRNSLISRNAAGQITNVVLFHLRTGRRIETFETRIGGIRRHSYSDGFLHRSKWNDLDEKNGLSSPEMEARQNYDMSGSAYVEVMQ